MTIDGKTPDDFKFDKFGAPIFHEIDGIRYWGREGEAEAYGYPLEECTLTDQQITQARRTAYQRQARSDALTKQADTIQKEVQDIQKEAQGERRVKDFGR